MTLFQPVSSLLWNIFQITSSVIRNIFQSPAVPIHLLSTSSFAAIVTTPFLFMPLANTTRKPSSRPHPHNRPPAFRVPRSGISCAFVFGRRPPTYPSLPSLCGTNANSCSAVDHPHIHPRAHNHRIYINAVVRDPAPNTSRETPSPAPSTMKCIAIHFTDNGHAPTGVSRTIGRRT